MARDQRSFSRPYIWTDCWLRLLGASAGDEQIVSHYPNQGNGHEVNECCCVAGHGTYSFHRSYAIMPFIPRLVKAEFCPKSHFGEESVPLRVTSPKSQLSLESVQVRICIIRIKIQRYSVVLIRGERSCIEHICSQRLPIKPPCVPRTQTRDETRNSHPEIAQGTAEGPPRGSLGA